MKLIMYMIKIFIWIAGCLLDSRQLGYFLRYFSIQLLGTKKFMTYWNQMFTVDAYYKNNIEKWLLYWSLHWLYSGSCVN